MSASHRIRGGGATPSPLLLALDLDLDLEAPRPFYRLTWITPGEEGQRALGLSGQLVSGQLVSADQRFEEIRKTKSDLSPRPSPFCDRIEQRQGGE